jgi:membrane protein insertase Oxa1/YidC/SpoIIIJ
MKDNLLLLATGIICAALAWVFFAYSQNYAFTIILLIFAVSALVRPVKSKFSNSLRGPNNKINSDGE